MDFLQELNEEQRKAVLAGGPVIIRAGPGTGKTKTLVSRIQYLLSAKQIDPAHILALTFTKKAATEMKERLVMSGIKELPFIGTFHSLAIHLLTLSGKTIQIVSEKEQENIIRKILKARQKSVSKRDVKAALLEISRMKNGLNQDDNIVQQYSVQLQKQNKLDYDDLIREIYSLLKTNNGVVPSFSHILVDEFQDTNRLQYEIVLKLFETSKVTNIFVIGDPYQSIYGFRGADASIFQQMKTDFPQVHEIVLQKNYRSKHHIIKVSSLLFPDMVSLRPVRAGTGTVTHLETYDEKTEAQWIIRDIQKQMGGTDMLQSAVIGPVEHDHIRFSDVAVIYRTHHIGRSLERWFAREAIPYQLVGGGSPYEKAHIQSIIENMRTFVQQGKHGLVSETVRLLSAALPVGKNNEAQTLDLQQFESTMQQFDRYPDGLSRALSYIDYLQAHEYYDPHVEKVTLLTMHAAKGLEFRQVYIAGFEKGIVPLMHSRDPDIRRDDNDSYEEEKRLLYVAMTRAKDNLTLITPRKRFAKKTLPSPFLALIQQDSVHDQIDEQIVLNEKRLKKWRDTKSQLTIF